MGIFPKMPILFMSVIIFGRGLLNKIHDKSDQELCS